MIAVLLFIIGLVSVLSSIALVGYNSPGLIASLSAAFSGPTADMVPAIMSVANGLSWAVIPVVGGLLLMGFARVIMLLGAINRSLRGAA